MIEQCTLKKPIMISVPNGKTITISCPVHEGGHKIVGSGPTL